MVAERVVPSAFRARSLNGSATPTVGAGRGRPATVVPVKAVPVGLAPGMLGRALAAPVTVADGIVEPAMGAAGIVKPAMGADGMGHQEMPAVSRFAVR